MNWADLMSVKKLVAVALAISVLGVACGRKSDLDTLPGRRSRPARTRKAKQPVTGTGEARRGQAVPSRSLIK